MFEPISDIADLQDRLDGEHIAMVSTIDERGTLSSRPVTIQEVRSNGDLWFLVDAHAEWVEPVAGAPVNASVATDRLWVSFAGRAELTSDELLLDALMDSVSESFFDDGSEPVVLRIVTDRIEWWAAPNKAAQLLDFVKTKVTNGTPNPGSSGTIEA